MNIKKIANRVHKIAPSVKVEEYRGCVRLSGELEKWEDIYLAGRAAVDKKHSLGVLNDIKLKDFEDTTVSHPILRDNAIDGKHVDVLIVGGGITGSAIARELAKLKLEVLLVEKGNDVASLGASCRNDGCVHPGIDLVPGLQKLEYVLRGNDLYEPLCKDLEVDFHRYSQIMYYFRSWERLLAPLTVLWSHVLGVKDVRYLSAKKLREIEPSTPKWLKGGVQMQSAGVVSPYKMTIALADNAAQNGVKFSLNTAAESMDLKEGKIVAVHTNRGTVYPRLVVNAAGVYSDVVAEMAGDRTFTVHPRKGTNLILDKKKAYYAIASVAKAPFSKFPVEFRPTPTAKVGHTKGGGVMRTADNNILVGPDAVEQPFREDHTTNIENINEIIKKQKFTATELNKGDVITYFSGVRAATYEEDFVVRKGIFTSNVIEAAGIQSPGITAAPAIGEDVRTWVKEMLDAEDNTSFNAHRPHTPRLADLDEKTRDEYIKCNPDYGEIVCRCEEVSKGEIVDALEQPLRVCTLDGIKRRVRPGMGRCQGGFCSPLVVKIIAEHEHISEEEVLKGEEGSRIVFGNVKEASNAHTCISGGEHK